MWNKIEQYRGTINQSVDYVNTQAVKIHSVSFLSRRAPKEIWVKFENSMNCRDFVQKVSATGLPAKEIIGVNILQLQSDKAEDYKAFLKLLLEYAEEEFWPISDEICKTIGIDSILHKKLNELTGMRPNDAIEAALVNQSRGHYDAMWELLKIYREDFLLGDKSTYKLNIQAIYNFANNFTQVNPYYPDAQLLCAHIRLESLDSTPEDEKYEDLQLIFSHLLEGNDQDLTDRIYHELCGGTLGDEYQKDIKGELNTLLGLAIKMRDLTIKLSSLNEVKLNAQSNNNQSGGNNSLFLRR